MICSIQVFPIRGARINCKFSDVKRVDELSGIRPPAFVPGSSTIAAAGTKNGFFAARYENCS
jgi:hypothetical protein